MLQHSATITFRHVLTQKLYSAITIPGLSVGRACFVLITLFVHSELTYDSRSEHADRIYHVSRDYLPSSPTGEAHFAGMPGLAAELLKEDFPQIEKVAHIYCCGAIWSTATAPCSSRTALPLPTTSCSRRVSSSL